jgi:hypothetical protein
MWKQRSWKQRSTCSWQGVSKMLKESLGGAQATWLQYILRYYTRIVLTNQWALELACCWRDKSLHCTILDQVQFSTRTNPIFYIFTCSTPMVPLSFKCLGFCIPIFVAFVSNFHPVDKTIICLSVALQQSTTNCTCIEPAKSGHCNSTCLIGFPISRVPTYPAP